MLMCNQTITIIHHVKGVDNDTYICTPHGEASWFKKRAITTDGDGAKPSNTYETRIMGSDEISVALGDYVVLGIVSAVEKLSDINSLDHFRITAIGDNRRGGLPHWRLTGQ